LTAASRLFLSPHFFADRRMPRSGRRAAFTRFLAFPLSVCGFRRSRPGIPIDVGHLFRSKSAGRSD
jgi:hypothetical protein